MAGKRNRKNKNRSAPLPIEASGPAQPRRQSDSPSGSNGKRHERSGTGRAGAGLSIPLDAPQTPEHIPDPPTRVVHLNVRLIVTTVAVLLVFAVGVHFLHAFQVDRQADLLRARADLAVDEDKTDDALALYSQYLRFRPHDADAIASYGKLLDRSGNSPEKWASAFFVFEEALNRDPERKDGNEIRRRMVELAIKIRRHADAIYHINLLLGLGTGDVLDTQEAEQLAKPPRDPALATKKANSRWALGKYRSAVNWYLYTIQHEPARVEGYAELANRIVSRPEALPLQKDLQEWDLERLKQGTDRVRIEFKVADDLKQIFPPEIKRSDTDEFEGAVVTAESVAIRFLDRMIEVAEPKYEARLARAEFRQSHGDLTGAAEDIAQALADHPNDPEVLLAAAQLAVTEAETAGSRRRTNDGNDDNADADEPLDPAAVQARIAERLEAANKYVTAGLAQENPNLRFHLVLHRIARFYSDRATSESQRRAHFKDAEGHLRDALDRLPEARKVVDADTEALDNVELELIWSLADVRILQSYGHEQAAKAAQALDEAAALTTDLRAKRVKPLAFADFLEGGILVARKRWPEAAGRLEQARGGLDRRPDLIRRIDLMLGLCYDELANPDARRDVFRRALRDDPGWGLARLNLADALVDQNRLDEALQEYDRIAGAPGVALKAARVAILRELTRPVALRQWDVARRALDSARLVGEATGDVTSSAAIAALEAEILALEAAVYDQNFRDAGDGQHRTDRDEKYRAAEGLLTQARDELAALPAVQAEDPESAPEHTRRLASQAANWAALAALDLRRLDRPEGERAPAAANRLQAARAAIGDHLELRLASISLALELPDAEARESLAQLASSEDGFSKAERIRLLEALARAWGQLGDGEKTRELWTRLADLEPTQISYRLVLARQALQEQNAEWFNRELAAIRQIEEPRGRDGEPDPESKTGPNANLLEAVSLIDAAQRAYRDESAAISANTDQTSAAQRVEEARQKLIKSLDEPRALLAMAAKHRPDWVPALHAQGDVEYLRGNVEGAVEHYRQAIDRGDRSETAASRVVSFLHRQGKFDDANRIVQQVSSDRPQLLSGELGRLASRVAKARNQFDEALPLAEALSRGSNRYTDKLWEAEVRLARGERGEPIVKLLNEAIDLTLANEPERAPDAFRALVVYYMRNGDKAAADQAIAAAREKLPRQPPHLAPYTLAVLSEMAGLTDQAEKDYQALIAVDPTNSSYRLELARFYVRNNRADQAGQHLDPLLNGDEPDFAKAQAERLMALATASGGAYDDISKAIDDLETAVRRRGKTASVEDLRVQAALVARLTTRADRRKLIGLFEQIDQQAPLALAERHQLARLYETAGDWRKAHATYKALIAEAPMSPEFHADFCFAALNQPELDEALRTEVNDSLDRLKNLEPKSFRVVAVESYLLGKRGQGDQAVPLLQDYLQRIEFAPPEQALRDLIQQKKPQEALAALSEYIRPHGGEEGPKIIEHVERLLEQNSDDEALQALERFLTASDIIQAVRIEFIRIVATILESIEQHPAAETAFRDYVARTHRSHASLVLAAYLARRNRLDEAFDVCEQTWSASPPPMQVAEVSVGALRSGQPTPAHIARVEQWLNAAIEQAASNERAAFMVRLADLRDFQGRHADAADIYQRILSEQPRNVVALNNLAWLLSFDRTTQPRALESISEAIRLMGPVAALRDTRAVVYLNMNHTAGAVADLKAALDEVREPSFYFHLAQAHAAQGDVRAAAEALEQARKAGFDPASLHSLERPGYDRLLEKLGDRPTAQR